MRTRDNMHIRELRADETELLKDFLYEALFIPEGYGAPGQIDYLSAGAFFVL